MVCNGLLMAMLPFGVFLGIGTLIQGNASDPRLLVTYILAALLLSFLVALGSFALIQRQNCGKVKNMNQISSNAGFAVLIQALTLLLVWAVPSLRRVVSGLLPPELDEVVKDSVGYSYYSFWAGLFGIAVGGTLSGICN